MSSQSRMSDDSRSRISENRHQVGIEQVAAQELEANRRARISGNETNEYVPLWRR